MNEKQAHQADPKHRARLRWRSRRGLLENDLILTRFLDKHELSLSDEDVAALNQLLALPDNELMDLIMGRTALLGELVNEGVEKVLEMIQSA